MQIVLHFIALITEHLQQHCWLQQRDSYTGKQDVIKSERIIAFIVILNNYVISCSYG